MSIRLNSLEIKAKLPELPATLPVFALSAPSFEERRTAIAGLGERLRLGAMRSVELDHATVLSGPQGDISYFHASGALWARDAAATKGLENEFRQWEGLIKTSIDGQRASLNAAAAKRLIGQSREMLQALGLLGKEVAAESVQLDQVAQLNAEGKELAQGAGQATIKFQYAVGGVPVRGAGAKTMAFAEPETSGQARVAGLFHAWRPLGKTSTLKLGKLEEALAVGLMTDPELAKYSAAGHKIQITRLDFVYMALPAFLRQSHLFPMFQIEGSVSEGKLGIAFNFGRFHHAAPPSAYAAADLYASYLSSNPDGISPSDASKTLG